MTRVEWSLIDPSRPSAVADGDLVSAEPGGLPIYEVTGVADDRLWLREQQSRRDCVLPAQSLRWRMERRAVAAI